VAARAAVVSIALAGAACLKIPAFNQQDAATGVGDTASDGSVPPPIDITGSVVTGPGYVINFSDAGARFPYQIIAGGNHMMGGSQQCADEQAMGIAVYPVYRANGADSPNMGAHVFTTRMRGPYVGQVQLDWSGNFNCTTGASELSGTSLFSFFPDGRITRFDRLTNSASRSAADCTMCTNGPSSNDFFVTSYTTLIVDNNAFVSDGNLIGASYGTQVPAGRTACVRERGQTIAFAWTDTQTRLRVANDTSVQTIAFIKDLMQGVTLPAQDFVTTTQMAISATGDCSALEARIGPFSDDDHRVTINGTDVGAALTDGIFHGGPLNDGLPVDFPVTITPTQTIATGMPAGFAVWLYSDPIPQNLTLTHSANPSGDWYRLQRVGQMGLVVWFDVPLADGQSITISGS
jgi:hypothetical protein